MLWRQASDDRGFALPTVMGAIALITVVAVSGFYLAQNTLTESVRVSEENRAYQAASSGLDQELSVFNRNMLPTGQSPSGYAYGTQQAINRNDWFIVSVNDSSDDPSLGPDEFEMISVGGSAEASETVRVRFMSFNLWDMNIAGADNSNMGSGSGFNGNGTIIGKVYCNGDFQWTGNGSLELGPVFVSNGVFNKQSTGSNVGSASDPVAAYFDNPPTGTNTNMYAEIKGSAPKVDIPWPTDADMANWRTKAVNDSAFNLFGTGVGDTTTVRHPSSVSEAQYNVFEGDLTLGGTNFGKPGPLIKSNGLINEPLSGDVIAVNGTTLHINGLVYIDGLLTISPAIREYSGKGMLVARDGIEIYGRLVPAAYNSGSWETYAGENMPLITTNECLGLASLSDVRQHSAEWVTAAVFTNGMYQATATGAKFRGSIIANGIDFAQPNVWLVTQPGMAANLPDGMPTLNEMRAESDWLRR